MGTRAYIAFGAATATFVANFLSQESGKILNESVANYIAESATISTAISSIFAAMFIYIVQGAAGISLFKRFFTNSAKAEGYWLIRVERVDWDRRFAVAHIYEADGLYHYDGYGIAEKDAQ